jgi:hypothetical protein
MLFRISEPLKRFPMPGAGFCLLILLGVAACDRLFTPPTVKLSPASPPLPSLVAVEAPPKPLQVDRISLTGITTIGGRQQALVSIDHQRPDEVRVGDRILGATIVKIRRDSRTLDASGGMAHHLDE